MIRYAAAVIALFVVSIPLVAEASPSDDESGYANDYAAAAKLQDALKRRDVRAVADLVQYPFGRERPFGDIKTSTEFAKDFDDYFDAANISRLLAAKAEQIGWRGIELANGSIWFNEGKIIAINLRTSTYEKKFANEKKLEERSLYFAARGYDRIEFVCNTRNLHIRTQYYGKDLRYFAWKKEAPLTSKPQLILTSGKLDFQGSGGDHTLTFRNGAYAYELEVTEICGEDCNNYLDVSKNDKLISRQVCN